MNKQLDVIALGELLIDFTSYDTSPQGNPLLEANPGGAPCNVLAMLAKLQHRTAFIGKVGNDGFGKQLKEAIEEMQIASDALVLDDNYPTTLAIVLKKANGDRDFSFYRNQGADIMLNKNEIPEELFKKARLFHYGSLSLCDEPSAEAHLLALSYAEKYGLIKSFDPNLREPLWSSLDKARAMIAKGLSHADVLKISDNEITWFTGEKDYDAGIQKLQAAYPNLKLIALTMGPDGSRAYYKDLRVEHPAYLNQGDIETTGCGDTFCACLLDMVLNKGLDKLKEDDLKAMLRFGNAAASIVSTRKGALRVMPTPQEIADFLKEKDNG